MLGGMAHCELISLGAFDIGRNNKWKLTTLFSIPAHYSCNNQIIMILHSQIRCIKYLSSNIYHHTISDPTFTLSFICKHLITIGRNKTFFKVLIVLMSLS